MYKLGGERIHTIKDPEVIAKAQQAYLDKLLINREKGALELSTGNYKPFEGYDPVKLAQTFNVILEYNEPTKDQVVKRIVEPALRLAQTHDIPAIFTSRGDLPPHTTLEAGVLKDLTDDQMKTLHRWVLTPESHLDRISSILNGLTFQLDTLVVAPNSYVCAVNFDPLQGTAFKARRAVVKMMRLSLRELNDPYIVNKEQLAQNAHKFTEPYPYDNIFHTSTFRLVGTAPKEKLIAFNAEVSQTIGADLQRSPINATVARVYRGSAFDFINRHAPQLIR